MKIKAQKLPNTSFQELNPHNPSYIRKFNLYVYNKAGRYWQYPDSLFNKDTILFIPKKEDLIVYEYLKKLEQEGKAIDWDKFNKQYEAATKLLAKHYGLLTSGVGSGKTIIMAIIAEILLRNGETVIVSSPKKQVDKQIFDEYSEIFKGHFKVELFNSKKAPQADIVVINHNSLHKYYNALSNYSAILIDEAHLNHTKNRIEMGVFGKYSYLYGFTGTPELNNYPVQALTKFYGDYIVDSGLRPSPPKILYYRYDGYYGTFENFQELKKVMYYYEPRIMRFVSIVAQVMQREDRQMGIIFVDEKKIAKILTEVLNKLGIYAKEFTGDIKLADRMDVLDDVRKHKGIIVATYQTAGVGFNYPPLNTAFYFMFVKFQGTVKQAIGRILRGAKDPLLLDFQDKNLYKQSKSRIVAYMQEFGNVDIQPFKYSDKQYLCIEEARQYADKDSFCFKLGNAVYEAVGKYKDEVDELLDF